MCAVHTATLLASLLALRLSALCWLATSALDIPSPYAAWLCALVVVLHVAYTTTTLCIRDDLSVQGWSAGLHAMSPLGYGLQQAGLCWAVAPLIGALDARGAWVGATVIVGHAVYAFVSVAVFDEYARRRGRA